MTVCTGEKFGGFPGGAVVENPPANAGDARDVGSLGVGHSNPLQYSCWKIPWTEESGGLKSMGPQRTEQH